MAHLRSLDMVVGWVAKNGKILSVSCLIVVYLCDCQSVLCLQESAVAKLKSLDTLMGWVANNRTVCQSVICMSDNQSVLYL